MKSMFLAIIVLLVSVNIYSQNPIKLELKKENVEYNINKGMLNGKYTSYYKSGNKKAEGNFTNNNRTGFWTIWDESGQILIQREYENSFSYKTIVPVNSKKISEIYKLEHNEDNYFKYFKISEDMVLYSKNIYRYLSKEDNPNLFNNNRLFKLINENAINKNIKIYDINDDFSKELDIEKFKFKDINIEGFLLKEASFYDNKRNIMETRNIGIMPIIIEGDKKTIPYLVYYTQLRKYLAKEKVEDISLLNGIENLDDIFFFRNFSGKLYGETNIYLSSEFTENILPNEIEIGIIEIEHDLWVQNLDLN